MEILFPDSVQGQGGSTVFWAHRDENREQGCCVTTLASCHNSCPASPVSAWLNLASAESAAPGLLWLGRLLGALARTFHIFCASGEPVVRGGREVLGTAYTALHCLADCLGEGESTPVVSSYSQISSDM